MDVNYLPSLSKKNSEKIQIVDEDENNIYKTSKRSLKNDFNEIIDKTLLLKNIVPTSDSFF